MNYYSYDYPSALTEERLAGIVCEGVKDYLSETTEYVKQCQETIAEQQEIMAEQRETIEALQRRTAELEECLNAIYTGKVSSVKNVYHYAAGSVHNDSRNIVSIHEGDKKKLIN